ELATWRRPALRLARTGYGFGTRDTGRLNAVRVWLGESAADTAGARNALEQVVLLETNLDDQIGEQMAFAAEELLRMGALDVWWQPIGMKKGRPGVLFSVLSTLEREPELVDRLFRETTTLGIRRSTVERWTSEREIRTVQTEWGVVRVKVKRWNGREIQSAPEYEDCARLAREAGVPLRAIYAAAERAAGDG
ncbi:MAG TPA: LarC family nickel insertion protein, partial [Herpetosiphonaceae bacterium]|nr:LarC family nickel insertion protein [Herpetosiphonaceae bacterium]